jgi:hypothetical protein
MSEIKWSGPGWYAAERGGCVSRIARHLGQNGLAAVQGIARAYGMSDVRWLESER